HGAHGGALLLLADFVVRTSDQESGGDQRIAVARAEHIAGELQPGEFVIRQVTIERIDDPVAILPGVGAQLVSLESLALTIADNVEPVSRPTLAIGRRTEQSLNEIS